MTGLKQRLLLRVKSFPMAWLASGVSHQMDALTSQFKRVVDTQRIGPSTRKPDCGRGRQKPLLTCLVGTRFRVPRLEGGVLTFCIKDQPCSHWIDGVRTHRVCAASIMELWWIVLAKTRSSPPVMAIRSSGGQGGSAHSKACFPELFSRVCRP